MKKYKNIICMILILGMTFLTGCSKIIPFFQEEKPDPLSNLPATAILIDRDEIRSETIDLINNAQKAIFIQLSALDDQDIIRLLVSKSQSGIEVRILLDQWQRENAATVTYLKNHNISVQYYPAEKGQYQRVRYLVVDYETAIFFGENWTGAGFSTHTLAVKLAGDTAWTMTRSFNKDWSYTTTLSLDLPDAMVFPEDNIIFTVNSGVKQQILKNINAATTEILAEVEQLSDPETVEALLEAKLRGCRIQLILSPSCAVATPNTIKKFKDAGIEVRYFNHPDKLPIGFNISLFDQKIFVMTNSSWTNYSFFINHEAALVIPSPAVADKVINLFQQEWETANEA